MRQAYASGDPYLTFAKQARAVPADATKASHGHVREQYKVCSLAVQYVARELLRAHHETYPIFWRWVRAAVDRAMLTGSLPSVFGWQIHSGTKVNPRSVMNFPMQANGAEILRLACCLMTERGSSARPDPGLMSPRLQAGRRFARPYLDSIACTIVSTVVESCVLPSKTS